MFESRTHTSSPTVSSSFCCSCRTLPNVPSPYCSYGFGIEKIYVLEGSYDLWRRLT